jgi:tyrosine-protein phosphatase 2/3
MDFFSQPGNPPKPNNAGAHDDDVNKFADAVNSRFPSALTARLESPVPGPSMSNMSLSARRAAKQPAAPPPSSSRSLNFPHVAVEALPELLASPDVFFIDVRPPGQYQSARLPNALSLTVPSIFLKRPLVGLERISSMLTSPDAQQRFNKWREAHRLVVYDADTSSLAEGNNVLGLLRKFEAESGASSDSPAYTGQISWLKGGFQAVWKERSDLVETKSLTDTSSDSDESPPPGESSAGGANIQPPASSADTFAAPKPVVRRLSGELGSHRHRPHFGQVAHSDASSSNQGGSQQSMVLSNASSRKPPSSQISSSLSLAPDRMARQAANPFFDNIRQNMELSQGITERIPLRLPKRVRRRIADLPFPWLRGIARGALGTSNAKDDSSSESSLASEADLDAEIPPSSAAEESENTEDEEIMDIRMGRYKPEPREVAESEVLTTAAEAESSKSKSPSRPSQHTRPPLPETSAEAVEVGMENLAMQFFRIELAEQRRLMGVMEHHSKESERWDSTAASASDGKIQSRQRRKSMSNVNSGSNVIMASNSGSNSGSGSGSNSNNSGPGTGSGTPVSSDSGAVAAKTHPSFPFSITAGVEKGAKNR